MSAFRVRRAPRLTHRAGWLILSVVLTAACSAPPAGRPILLVTVDALRADRVGLYDSSAPPTPNFDRVGDEGAFVETAVAPAPRTTQSVGAILTGLHPLAHGADGLGMRLPDHVETIAEILRGRGYNTAAFVSNVFLRSGLGFEQGFDIYSNPPPRWEGNSAAAITDEALAWLEQSGRDKRPWFLWLHYLDPHWTYDPAPTFAHRADPAWTDDDPALADLRRGVAPLGRLIFDAESLLPPRSIDHVRKLYDGEVAAADDALGRLLGGLESAGLLDRAIVVVTADHGESLGEHGYYFAHGEYLYDSTLRVPLLFRAPGLIPPGTRVGGVGGLEDLTPTLLELAGAASPLGIDGVSLATALKAGGQVNAPSRPVVQFADHLLVRAENPRRPVPGREGRWWAIRVDNWKLIRIPLPGARFAEELYDLAADPGETHDLAGVRPDVAERLRTALLERQRSLLARWQQSGALEAEPTAHDALRGLGYIQ